MRIKFLVFIILSIAFFSLSSCLNIKPLSIGKIESVKIQNYDAEALILKIRVKVINSNNLKFKIKDNRLGLFLNGKEIGNAKVTETVIIKKYSDETHDFIIEASLSNVSLIGIIGVSSLISPKPVEFGIKGEVKVKTLGFTRKYPIDISEKIDLRELGKNFFN